MLGFPGGSDSPPVVQQTRVSPWVRKIPWRRQWLSIPVFLPGEFHGQRNLVGSNPWGHTESDTTEWLTLHFSVLTRFKRQSPVVVLVSKFQPWSRKELSLLEDQTSLVIFLLTTEGERYRTMKTNTSPLHKM